MRTPPPRLAEFERDPERRFEYLTRHEIDSIVTTVRDLAEECHGFRDADDAKSVLSGASSDSDA